MPNLIGTLLAATLAISCFGTCSGQYIDFSSYPASPAENLTVGSVTFSGGQIIANPPLFGIGYTNNVYGTSSSCTGCSETMTISFATPVSNVCLSLLTATDYITYTISDDQGFSVSYTPNNSIYGQIYDGCIADSNVSKVTIDEHSVYQYNGPLWNMDIGYISYQNSGALPVVVTPSLSPNAGTFTAPLVVTISDATIGANIYYTTDGTVPTIASALYTGPITVKNSENIQAIAAAAGYNNSTVASATYTITLPIAPTAQLLDPTPLALADPTQSLMNGNQVTSTLATLDTLGRAVQGIAADGTSEIVLRIPTNAANDIVTATVLSDTCTNSADPSTCAVSTSAAFDGGLVALANAANPSQAAPTAPVTAADSNNFAYVIYRAPADFVRLGNSNDQSLSARSIEFKLTYETAQGASYGTQYVPLTIVRPPVVLTHGYASNAVETWTGIWNTFATMAHTTIYEVDYGSPIQLVSTIPAIACLPTCVTLVNKSDLGITYNTPSVATQTLAKLRDYALGHNAANAPVSVSQVDSIGHSMGGVIERYWSTNAAANLDGTAVPFNTPDNFGNGYIHKLITLGTPHFGSPFATESLSTGQSGSGNGLGAECFRNFSALEIRSPSSGDVVKPGRYQVGTAVLDGAGTRVGGAIGDLDGDGIGVRLSAPLSKVKTNAAHLPTFTIAGTATPYTLGGYDFVNAVCGLLQDPIADRMTIQLYGTLFDASLTPSTDLVQGVSTINDGAVPLTSALNGRLCSGSGAQCFDGDAHGKGTAFLLSYDLGDNLLSDSKVLSLVQQLLNTSVADTTRWVVQ